MKANYQSMCGDERNRHVSHDARWRSAATNNLTQVNESSLHTTTATHLHSP